LESKLKELGATVETFAPCFRDGMLVTGQNHQSSVSCAKLAIAAMKPVVVQAEKTVPEQAAEQATEQAIEKVEDSPAKEETPADNGVIEIETKTAVCC